MSKLDPVFESGNKVQSQIPEIVDMDSLRKFTLSIDVTNSQLQMLAMHNNSLSRDEFMTILEASDVLLEMFCYTQSLCSLQDNNDPHLILVDWNVVRDNLNRQFKRYPVLSKVGLMTKQEPSKVWYAD